MSNNITKLLTALVGGAQDVETALQQLLTERAINTAVGVNLDQIGTIVGQRRQGLDDETYRAYLRTRIATSRSRGTESSILRIARAMIGSNISTTLTYDNQGRAAFVLRVLGNVIPALIANGLLYFLQLGASAGVRVIVERLTTVESDTLFTPYFAFLNGAQLSGVTTLVVGSTSGFPDSGTLDIDLGLTVHDQVTYTGKTGTSFLGVTGVAHNHVDKSGVTSVTPGKGLGDSTDATIGGQFVSAESED